MKFIGRKEELGKLEAEYQRDGSFVVVYGRRRVGKTTLIKEFIKNKTAFYYLATEELEVQSMKRLAGVIGRATNNSLLNKAVFNDWLDLFQLVADYKPNEKKVLVIDEFPYLVKTNPAFPSILQNAWDELLKDNNVMLILSGSLIGMMLKHTLSYDSPLYGRRTAQMRLSSLPFNDVYIASALNQDTSSITPYLSTLTELGFIEKRIPVTEKNPEKTRKGLYFISDNFIRFWFHYVYPYKGELELDNVQIVLDEINKDFKEKFVAFAYEDICKEIFQNLCKKGSIDFVPSRIGSYWLNDFNNDTEIDVMAIDNQNKRIFVGECKYHNKSVDAQVYFSLKEKVENNDEIKKGFTGFELIYGLFSKSGFTNRMLDIAKENVDILLINDDTLLK